jgi:mono/diheme cytochrome c family protein
MRLMKFGAVFLLLAGILVACAPTTEVVNTEYVLTTAMRDGNFVYLGVDGEINGVVNPALHAKPGERITIMLVNSGYGKHDIVFEDIKVKSDTITQKGETTSITFTVPDKDVALKYYDSTHERLGMRGVLLVGAAQESAGGAGQSAAKPAGLYENELAILAFQKGGCTACHTIPGVAGAGAIGPDLSEIGKVVTERMAKGEYSGMAKTTEEYLLEAIQSPDVFLSPACPTGPCTAGMMPATLAQLLSAAELDGVVKYLASLPGGAVVAGTGTGGTEASAPVGDTPALTNEEFAWAKQTFFDRCAGCHGTLRKGATGPALTPDKTLPKGTVGLAAIIFNGTSRGMPDWGKQGVLTQSETETMAKYLQNEPPAPPELSLQQMKDSWQLITPVDQRPNLAADHTRHRELFHRDPARRRAGGDH